MADPSSSAGVEEDDFPGHLLHRAALWDNAELLLDLLNGELKAFINSQDSWGRVPLHAAVTTDCSSCVNILLEGGANPNCTSGAKDNYMTPLHVSAEHGYLSNVQRLVEAGADITKVDGRGLTAMDLAERGGHLSCHEYLQSAAAVEETARHGIHTKLRDAATKCDLKLVKSILDTMNSKDIATIVNETSHGSNTLLFKAAESGNKQLVHLLCDNGADSRVHPVTKYSPLYIACYYGHRDVVAYLLNKFPALIGIPTVEKWLPLHAACINGHFHIVDLLLKHSYPPELYRIYAVPMHPELEVELPFDINLKDVSGQTALYIGCQMGNQKLVELLLQHRVQGRPVGQSASDVTPKVEEPPQTPTSPSSESGPGSTSPGKKRIISEGIQGILSKLSLATKQNLSAATPKKMENMICPLNINTYCEDYQTALHVAVKNKHHVIVSALLQSGADPNIPILPAPHAVTPYQQVVQRKREDTSTALVEACQLRDLGLVDLLIKYGATDNESKALAVSAKDDIIVGKILALKAHQDSENKVNCQYIKENVLQSMKKPLLVTSILPSTSVTLNWHNQKLSKINDQWMISATLKLNPKLRLCPKNQSLGLLAITRLDLSSNCLESIPSVIFTFCSLVYLNLSQNKISQLVFPLKLDVPKLEEILLHENRIEFCPPQLFYIPSLHILNLANNKLRHLPSSMWDAPNLQELNVSLNLLTDLPPLDGEASDEPASIMFDSLPYIPSEAMQNSVNQSGTPSTMSPLSPDTVLVPSGRSFFLAHGSVDGRSSPLLTHHALWRQRLNVVQNSKDAKSQLMQTLNEKASTLLYLNLSHNSFCKIPKVLACLAPTLQRLNMSYNRLRYMGHIGYYPTSLRQLDLSHNNVDKWFYAPTAGDSPGKLVGPKIRLQCYARMCDVSNDEAGENCCSHKRHSRLEALKSLVLAGNQLENISVGGTDLTSEEVWASGPSGDKRSNSKSLWFPNVTLLDLSDNALNDVTVRIAELKSLSVLNLSGNFGVTDLPPELGTLKHLWNLNLSGCSLQEPLLSMIERKRCKTMDIIGYLKSVLEDAKPYSRMKLMVVGVAGIGKTTILQQMRQETSGSQQKYALQQDHWAKRMSFQAQGGGNTSATSRNASPSSGIQKSGKPISTVGVDIGSWALDPKVHRSAGHGPVIFRTWDFGGQREYYATHLYFLSKRSLYLVLWNICDGEKGLCEIVQWLVNIQARAPNSPVIIVGTHYDLVSEKFPPGYLDYLQQKIREKFIRVTDPEKRGLPRVLYSIEVSCKTKHNIRYLTNLLYETAWSLKTNNGKILLEQKIPSKYIHLEEISAFLAQERKSQGLEPVLTESEFKAQVSSWLQKGFNLTFRDDAEIMQACSFLHENGILLHFEDSVLQDLYFLDPQSLCDLLANVVTIREINPFAKNGVMKIDDLGILFKGKSSITKEYILSLLSKFELAVPIDKPNQLLIPSLLPTYEQMKTGQYDVKLRINVRPKRWTPSNRSASSESQLVASSAGASPARAAVENMEELPYWIPEKGELIPLSRFVLLSYFPSGFWSRLISRILSDDRIVEIIRDYFIITPTTPTPNVHEMANNLCREVEWSLWQNGLEVHYGPTNILYVKEVTGEKPFSFMLRRDETVCELVEPSPAGDTPGRNSEEPEEQVWEVVDLSETSLLEIHLPVERLRLSSDEPEHGQTTLEPSLENVTKLLALVVDHIDSLLEDWYPSIGTRFVHTSEGKYLVTRLIPCPRCFPNQQPHSLSSGSDMEQRRHPYHLTNSPDSSKSPRMSSDSGVGNSPQATKASSSVDSMSSVEVDDSNLNLRTRTGLVFETPKFANIPSSSSFMSGLNYFLKPETRLRNLTRNMYSWTVEHCILESQKGSYSAGSPEVTVKCPKHGGISLSQVAPDVLFLDLNKNSILSIQDIRRDKLLGRGAFGFVFGGTLRAQTKHSGPVTEIAIKMFQPMDPSIKGSESSHNQSESMNEAQVAYKLAYNKWHRSPSQSACRAYSACRGEVRVLYWVKHEHIVPFLGLCQSPLSILLRRAPFGSLNRILNDFKRSGDHLKEETLKVCILQVAGALEYLHRNHIIYRDLKSENVLVWSFPIPFAIRDIDKVDIKLADYGISRSSFAMGFSKGFGGTEGYMAPEIIRYNGEEEYTEKVDIFSFGMLLYELMSLKQPFDNCDNIKESILEGDRPSLTQKESNLYPLYILDLMVSCWSNAANERPSAAQIVTIASATEFLVLRDVVTIGNVTNIVTAIGIEYGLEKEVWTSCSTGGIYCLKVHKTDMQFESSYCFELITGVVTAMCQISQDLIWMGDTTGKIHSMRVSDYGKLTEIDLESQTGTCGAITCIEVIGSRLVAVVVSSGRLFLCNPNINNGQVISELGNNAVIHCLACRTLAEGEFEIWAGERAGQMTIFSIKNDIVVQQEAINHYEIEMVLEGVQVLIIKSHPSQEVLFSYVFPGSVIYGWDTENREMIARLDVGRLLPIRDAGMDDLSQKPLQVTMIHPAPLHVYIGTSWGFIFITDVKYLKPLAILQPFQDDVRSFWMFGSHFSEMTTLSSRRSSYASTAGSEVDRADERRETSTPSPNPTSSKKKPESIDTVMGDSPTLGASADDIDNDLNQLVVVLGKGFSSIIQQNAFDDQRRKRVFAILWKVNSHTSWN